MYWDLLVDFGCLVKECVILISLKEQLLLTLGNLVDFKRID